MNKLLKQTERGRSMVEMLGVLAIMALLSIMGIRGFNIMMTKHKANELLKQANMRAVSLSSQILAEKPDLSADDFDNTTEYGTFGEPTRNVAANTFTLPLTGVESDVAKQMKATVGDDSYMTIADGANNSLELTFNNDLSKRGSASGGGSGGTGSGEGGSGSEGGNGTDDNNENNGDEPTECPTGTSDTYAGDYQGGAFTVGSLTCYCPTGKSYQNNACANVPNSCTSYTTAECGEGYYCEFANATASDPGTGTCKEIPDSTKPTSYENGGEMNWWTASSFCMGFGSTLLPGKCFQDPFAWSVSYWWGNGSYVDQEGTIKDDKQRNVVNGTYALCDFPFPDICFAFVANGPYPPSHDCGVGVRRHGYSNRCTGHSYCCCGACVKGYTLNGSTCEPCAAGTYKGLEGNESCSSCAAGTYSAAGATECMTCPANTYSGAEASSCTPCPNGKKSPVGSTSESACVECLTNADCTSGKTCNASHQCQGSCNTSAAGDSQAACEVCEGEYRRYEDFGTVDGGGGTIYEGSEGFCCVGKIISYYCCPKGSTGVTAINGECCPANTHAVPIILFGTDFEGEPFRYQPGDEYCCPLTAVAYEDNQDLGQGHCVDSNSNPVSN